MKHIKLLLRHHWSLLCIVVVSLLIGLFRLDNLPAEMWGDAIEHYHLAQQVQRGHFFFNYQFGGDGPIFSYIVILISSLFSLSFYTLKLTSVFLSVLFVFVLYLFSYELFKKKDIAYLTAFLGAISFWTIVFARQPHARILVPLFIVLTMLFAVKKKTLLSGITLGLGMYTQASFWAMPLALLKRFKIVIIGFVITVPLILSFARNKANFFSNSSYFGEKLATTDHLPFSVIVQNILHNIGANFLSFFYRGDMGFRMNVPVSPHLDGASALFLGIGLVLLGYKVYKERRWKYLEFLILPFFLIQIPSLLDIHNASVQPNIGRMIGVIPFVYCITAYGLLTSLRLLTKTLFERMYLRKLVYWFCLFYLLAVIAIANLQKYFVIYPYFLPDHNTPFAKIIAQTIDRYPTDTSFVITETGWGQWQQPEQGAIMLGMKKYHAVTFLRPPVSEKTLCQHATVSHPLAFITRPSDMNLAKELSHCGITAHPFIIKNNDIPVAKIVEISAK